MKKLPFLKSVHLLFACVCLIAAAVAVPSLQAQILPPLDAIRIAGGFSSPRFLTCPPNDISRLFVVEQGGLIRIIDLTTRIMKPTPFLDLSDEVSFVSEEGLLGLAFDPNYAANGRFYVNYVAPGGSFGQGVTHVALFRVSSNPDVADASSERTLLTFDQSQTNHNGGWLGFSPRAGDEGNLYIATGDGGSSNDKGPRPHRARRQLAKHDDVARQDAADSP
jgi:glucose/arabinose dehydrogenase